MNQTHRRHQFHFHLIISLWLCVAMHSEAAANDADLAATLRNTIRESRLAASTGVSLVEAASGRSLFAYRDQELFSPASNVKILTAHALLKALGPGFRIRSSAHGHVHKQRIEGGLFFASEGDPSLDTEDFLSLGSTLRQLGITDIDRLILDQSYFDSETLPPAFDQQPNEDAAFRAPVGAVSVNANAYGIRITPSSTLEQQPKVQVSIPGYLRISNQLVSSPGKSANITSKQHACGNYLCLQLTGKVGTHASEQILRRRINHPGLAAGWTLIESLRQLGICVKHPIPLFGTRPSDPHSLGEKLGAALDFALSAWQRQQQFHC
ncbi:MAG: D-alanyl-D-alanine carboxypeptidase [Myxococcales bacterium]|nr:MAG: D-alanyl-D-alanine carboxypeptidase [Myxococcales bacterium]